MYSTDTMLHNSRLWHLVRYAGQWFGSSCIGPQLAVRLYDNVLGVLQGVELVLDTVG